MAKITAKSINDIMLEHYTYDPQTGVCTNKDSGKCGSKRKDGYTILRKMVDYKQYQMLAHRFAFLFMIGKQPNELVDHIDCDRGNNKWNNLREANYNENSCNSTGHSKLGLKNITLEKGKYRVRVVSDKMAVFDKRFKELDLAELAATEAREKFHGKFAYKETT